MFTFSVGFLAFPQFMISARFLICLLVQTVFLNGFANDITLVITVHTVVLLEKLVKPVLSKIKQWMVTSSLKLAPQKSEALFFTKKWAYRDSVLLVNG